MISRNFFFSFIISYFISVGCINGQVFTFVDVGNAILTRPNLGIEYRKNKHALYAAAQWQRNYLGGCEMPVLEKSNGFRIDIGYKYFINKRFFVEPKIRYQDVEIPYKESNNKFCPTVSPFNSFESALKFGTGKAYKNNIATDLSLGLGLKATNWMYPPRTSESKRVIEPTIHIQYRVFFMLKTQKNS